VKARPERESAVPNVEALRLEREPPHRPSGIGAPIFATVPPCVQSSNLTRVVIGNRDAGVVFALR